MLVSDYVAAGVEGVTAGNLAAVNFQVRQAIAQAAQGTTVGTNPTLDTAVAAAVAALAKVEAYNNGNGTTPAALTVNDYLQAGITGVRADNLSAVNAKVLAAATGGADTTGEIQALVTQAALDFLASYANSNGDGSVRAPVAQDYIDAGVRFTVTSANVGLINKFLAEATVSGTQVDSTVELDELIGYKSLQYLRYAARDDDAGANTNDYGVALTPQAYQFAGVTGVTNDTIGIVNGGLDAVSVSDATINSARDIQALVDAASRIKAAVASGSSIAAADLVTLGLAATTSTFTSQEVETARAFLTSVNWPAGAATDYDTLADALQRQARLEKIAAWAQPDWSSAAAVTDYIQLSQSFENADFSAPLNGGEIPGWTKFAQRVDLGITTFNFDGDTYVFPEDVNAPVGSTGVKSRADSTSYTAAAAGYTVTVISPAGDSNGAHIQFTTPNGTMGDAYGVAHGPALISSSSVSLNPGDAISFDWRAIAAGDSYDVYGFMMNVSDSSDQGE